VHVPGPVQASLSAQEAPSLPGIPGPQPLIPSSHCPRWQESGEGQNLGVPPTQTPSLQASLSVQNIPSSQAAPLLAGVFWHMPLTQLPVLHTSSSAAQSAFMTQGPGAPVEVEVVV